MKEHRGGLDATGKRFAIVVSRWNEQITEKLLEGALEELQSRGASEVEVVRVVGSWEIPVAVSALLSRDGARPHAVVALGCIHQGETSHAAMLAAEVGAALMSLQTQHRVPVTWGILTPASEAQAMERAGPKTNRGREAAQAAVEMSSVLEKI